MRKAVGIDLGTTYSVVAAIEGGKAEIIPNLEGFRTTPSTVGYVPNRRVIVGQIAKRQCIVNSINTITSVKRFMGARIFELDSESVDMPYKVMADDNFNILLYCPLVNREFRPEEISSIILRKVIEDAAVSTGKIINRAVVTVPAYFNVSQRKATQNAAEMAGLEVLRIINEPTAAALAYGLDKNKHEIIVIFDLGGGTFDVSVLEVGEGVFEVLAASGDSHLGGDNFDRTLLNYVVDEYYAQSNLDIRSNTTSLQRVTDAVEQAKIILSSMPIAFITVPFVIPHIKEDEPNHLLMEITRGKFEKLCSKLFARCYDPVEIAIKDSGVGKKLIDNVVLGGGSTRIPAVESIVAEVVGMELTKNINPDEVVAMGAAIQAGVLARELKEMLLLDVTPLSLGVEIMGGGFSRIIDRNDTIPVQKIEPFSTSELGQTTAEIKVFQGERDIAQANKCLGVFTLTGIRPVGQSLPRIDVIFDLDVGGLLTVTARDAKTLKEQSIIIRDSGDLTKEDVENMTKEAARYKKIDQRKLKENSLKRKLERLCKLADPILPMNSQGANIQNKNIEFLEETIVQIRRVIDSGRNSTLELLIPLKRDLLYYMTYFHLI